MTLLVCTIQAVATAQTNYQRIFSFGPVTQLGSSPRGELMEGSDGLMYGTTYLGGTNSAGTIFSIAKDGTGFRVLHSLSEGSYPYAGLVEGGDGALYGLSSSGGAFYGGIAFKLNKDGSGFSVLRHLGTNAADGVAPIGTLCRGADGAFYGTASGGGTGDKGTIFKLSSNGTNFSVLHTFTGLTNGIDGSYPATGLLQARDGVMYGTTQLGGSNDFGTVFKSNPDGTGYAVIHHFVGAPADGHIPSGILVQAADGLLYGTTRYGGTNDSGVVFKVDTNGNDYAVLKSFSGGADGKQPLAGLTLGAGGALYGTTRFGGAADGGVAFNLGTDGSGFAVLHSFTGTNGDGAQPLTGLLHGSDGAWYGSCYFGGDYITNGVGGVLFRLFPASPLVLVTGIRCYSSSVVLSFAGGAAGQTYQIMASPDLSLGSWQSIGSSVAAIDGSFQFSDVASSGQPIRFYRSKLP